jgi:hypothetical protein
LYDPFDRLAGLYLVLKPEQHHAVFFLFIAIQIQFWKSISPSEVFARIVNDFLEPPAFLLSQTAAPDASPSRREPASCFTRLTSSSSE